MDLGEAVSGADPCAARLSRMAWFDPRHPASLVSETEQAFGGEPTKACLAIGLGFRSRCTAETLANLVGDARARLAAAHPGLAAAPAVLATIAEKDRPVLHAAAGRLGLAVVILPKAALAASGDRITVASKVARACLGIPSVAEAAALAAAGPGARLLVTRIAVPDATCAVAIGHRPSPEAS